MLDRGGKCSERSSTSKLICATVTKVFFEGLCGIEEGFEEVLPVLNSLNLLAFLANFTITIVFDVQRKYAPFALESGTTDSIFSVVTCWYAQTHRTGNATIFLVECKGYFPNNSSTKAKRRFIIHIHIFLPAYY